MKKVSLFWCLGNLEAISFFSLFLTFTVQPPSVSRQRCHMNIRSGRCYLMKEGRTGEEGVGVGGGKWGEEKRGSWGGGCSCNQSTILQTEGKRQPTADGAVEMTEAKWSTLRLFDQVRKEKKGREQKKPKTKTKAAKMTRERQQEPRFAPFISSRHTCRSERLSFDFIYIYMSPPRHPPLPAATAVYCLKQSGKSKRKSSAAPSGRRKIGFFLGDNICSIIHILEEVWWESDPKWKKWAQHKETQTTFSNWWKK